jgi:hypothetical protein
MMKTIRFTLLLVGLVVLSSGTSLAQETQTDKTAELRIHVRQVEVAGVTGKSVAIQQLHKRALLSSRKQLLASIDDDLKALRTMQTAVGNSDAETRNDINAQMELLTRERTSLIANIEQATDASGLASASESSPSSNTSTEPRDSLVSSRNTIEAGGPVIGSAESSVTASSTANAPPAETVGPDAGAPATLPQNLDVNNCKLTNTYTDAPALLVQRVEQAASAIAQDTNTDLNRRLRGLSAVYPYLMFFTVADAVLPQGVNNAPAVNIRTIDRLQYLGETARTDKQIGSSPRSTGSTSAIEKPGFARLLGFAIENGGILQNTDNTTLTLSTSPYLLYTMNGGGDSVENYNKAGFLNRIGVSASFNMTDTENPLANVKRGELTEWGVKARLFGDRSTRSKSFQKFWDAKIRPFVEAKGRAIGEPVDFIDNNPVLRPLRNQTREQLRAALIQLLSASDYQSAPEADKEIMLRNVIYCFMRSAVYDPIRSNTIDVGNEARTKITDEYVPRVAQAFANMLEAKKLLAEGLDELSKGPLATFGYTNHRQPTGSDYSEFKFLYEQDKTVFRMLKIVANVGLTVYNKPNPLLNQSRVRDFAAALSFEGSTASPFLKNQPDMSRITYAFTGNYERVKENEGMLGRRPDLAAFQFKIDIPIIGGMSLPFAVTYANATETTNEEHTRFNFGFKLDWDKLFALTKLVGKP